MCTPRLLAVSLLLAAGACTSPEDGLQADLAQKCSDVVAGHQNAAAAKVTRTALMREDWVQVDGTMEWRGRDGVLRNAWTCDMFRGEDGVWRRKYLSFGPA